MALSVTDLLTIKQIPDQKDLSLKTIAFFYEEHLMNRQFKFHIRHRAQEIRVRFEEGSLCHLLGVHHIVSGQEGRSVRGHANIINDVITFESMKKLNAGKFEEFKQRMLAFPLVLQIIKQPTFFEYDPRTNIAKMNWEASSRFGKVYVQLQLRKANPNNPNFYAPVSVRISDQPPRKTRIDVKQVEELPIDEDWI
ncbi:hypothetical protein B1748_34140 [Paenibacillus sp. MY03]|uniref:PBECR4 domain-containing protein n=1 Tax=Paenibacillus sp. MY03 TaxID=302980 RepID=UPI000B3C3BD0|nr:PBECR4 domain-containing protein [Paenibacillus sp. MY03]OUS68314.1 hypothetical protein B1748_34140 [Paenibacillus sp. MY03]